MNGPFGRQRLKELKLGYLSLAVHDVYQQGLDTIGSRYGDSLAQRMLAYLNSGVIEEAIYAELAKPPFRL